MHKTMLVHNVNCFQPSKSALIGEATRQPCSLTASLKECLFGWLQSLTELPILVKLMIIPKFKTILMLMGRTATLGA